MNVELLGNNEVPNYIDGLALDCGKTSALVTELL